MRVWQSCEADGGSCQTMTSEKAATYKVKEADLGRRLRVEIKADTNGPNNLPNPIYVYSALSDVVTPPPAPDPDPTPTPQPNEPQATPIPQPTPSPTPDTVAPVLGVKAVSSKLKPNTALKLSATLSEGASLSVTYERKRTGRKVGKTCKPGAKKGKKCTVYSKLATVKVSGVGGSSTMTLPKRKLAAGDYRVVVTPTDAAGNKGKAMTVSFKVRK